MKFDTVVPFSNRLTPLATCVALALGVTSMAALANVRPTVQSAAASSMVGQNVAAARMFRTENSVTPITSATRTVTSCLDDGSSGTLRTVLGTAGSGDIIDLSTLTTCPSSTITLTAGQLATTAGTLTFQGPPVTPSGPALTIDAGGANRFLYSNTTSGTVTIDSLAIKNGKFNLDNGKANGGCIFAKNNLTLSNASVSNCVNTGADTWGGAISSFGKVTLTNSTVSGSSATAQTTATGTGTNIQAIGGGIYAYLGVDATNSVVSGNSAVLGDDLSGKVTSMYCAGGGISISPFAQSSYTSTITSSTISGNSSSKDGAGIYIGGYYVPQTLVVNSSTISANSASFIGGGVDLGSGASATISNSTISGNKVYLVGGVNAYSATSLTLQNSTIAFNNAAYGAGGLYASPNGTLSSNSTIIANNSLTDTGHAPDLATATTGAVSVSGANNLVMTSDATITFVNAPLTADPKLLPLANNGGPTQTHALDVGSPAVDAGNNVAGLTYDQRGPGFPRTIGVATDIGAVESNVIADRIFANGFE